MVHTDLSGDDWWAQSDRDLRAAEHLLDGEFWAHAVAFAHLAVEKALKATLRSQTDAAPPVTHDLAVLLDRSGLDIPHNLADDVDALTGLDITRLYTPDALFGRRLDSRADDARHAIAAARSIVEWLRRAS